MATLPLPNPAVSGQHRLAQALDQSEALGALLRRLEHSRQRLHTVHPLLPPALQAPGLVQAGSLDDSTWVLLAAHASAGAKLRQCLPDLEAALAQAGWPVVALKVKVRKDAPRSG